MATARALFLGCCTALLAPTLSESGTPEAPPTPAHNGGFTERLAPPTAGRKPHILRLLIVRGAQPRSASPRLTQRAHFLSRRCSRPWLTDPLTLH